MKFRSALAALATMSSVYALLSAGGAQAANLTAAQILNDYSLVVLGNLAENSETDGKVFVGGTLTGGGNFDTHNVQSSTIPALTVGTYAATNSVNLNGAGGLLVGSSLTTTNFNNNGNGNIYVNGNLSNANLNIQNGMSVYVTGNVSSSNISINNSGNNLYVGGTVSGSNVNVNGGGGYYKGSSVPASVVPSVTAETSSITSTMDSFSTSLAKMKVANSSLTISNGTANFSTSGSGVAVFDITDASTFFSTTNQINFSLGSKTTEVIINVSGATGTLNIGENFLNSVATSMGTDTVWNFTDATSINVEDQFGGSILALDANVTTSGNIEGTLIAKSVTQDAEIHFDGTNTHISAVPLPATLPMFGAGLLGVGAWARRRKAAKQA